MCATTTALKEISKVKTTIWGLQNINSPYHSFIGWGSTFETTKCRMTNISEFLNFEYYNNEI